MGIGDWGLGIGPNPQSPIPNPQSPLIILYFNQLLNLFYYMLYYKINTIAKQIILILFQGKYKIFPIIIIIIKYCFMF